MLSYTKNLTLLYLENDNDLQNEMLNISSEYFEEVQIASDVDAGLKKYNDFYKSKQQYFDIVIVNVGLKTNVEIEFIKEVIKTNPKQNIIVTYDQNSSNSHLVELNNLNISSFIFKPFSHQSILDKISNVSKIIHNEYMNKYYQEHLELSIQERIQEVEEKNKVIVQQSKFAAMGEMISMIAHQWKQPLNVLSLNLASLEVMQFTQEYSQQDLEYIISNSSETIDYMSSTIYDFINFLNPKQSVDVVPINEIFYQIESIIGSDIKKYKIDFNISFHTGKGNNIGIYLSKFTQVIINIIKNSIDEFKSKQIKDPYIKIEVIKEHKDYKIEIKDNAGGIDQDILKNIFEPYVSTKGKNGTGLGMYMSKLIIEGYMNGEITARNDNSNAIFTIKLPINSN